MNLHLRIDIQNSEKLKIPTFWSFCKSQKISKETFNLGPFFESLLFSVLCILLVERYFFCSKSWKKYVKNPLLKCFSTLHEILKSLGGSLSFCHFMEMDSDFKSYFGKLRSLAIAKISDFCAKRYLRWRQNFERCLSVCCL